MDYINAFWTGGLICVIGQILIDKTKLTPARILTGFVVAGVILGAVGLYEPFAEFAGAGAAVPISGFGFLMSQGVKRDLLRTALSVFSRADLKVRRQVFLRQYSLA